jgi:hypothetical protein
MLEGGRCAALMGCMTAPTTLRFQQMAFDLPEAPCQLPSPPPSLLIGYDKPADAKVTQLTLDLR